MIAVPDKRTTNILKGAKERVKVGREITKVEKEIDSNHSFSATQTKTES